MDWIGIIVCIILIIGIKGYSVAYEKGKQLFGKVLTDAAMTDELRAEIEVFLGISKLRRGKEL